MLKNIIILVASFLCFWIVFTSLQNSFIYNRSLGLISKNWDNQNGERKLIDKPYKKLDNKNIIQWDACHYQLIKENGYCVEKAGGDYIYAFFPFFPLLWRLIHLPPVGIIFLNYLMFSLSILLFLRLFSKKNNDLNNIILTLSLPSLVIFFIPYTEATFMLLIAISIYGFLKNKYWIFFIGFLFASMTRSAYTILFVSIIATEIFFFLNTRKIFLTVKNIFLRVLPLIIGTFCVSVIQLYYKSGSFIKFIEVLKYWGNSLGIPHNIRDWSHEGFAINLGLIFLIIVPFLIIIIQLSYYQICNYINKKIIHVDKVNYLKILSLVYITGSAMYLILFRGGSLHCLFRYIICSPFIFVLFYSSYDDIKKIPEKYIFFIMSSLIVLSLFMLAVINYSTYWNFSDFGIFILISTILFWLFQDYSESLIYKIFLYINLFLNIIWTTYLFNTYINNGWIYA